MSAETTPVLSRATVGVRTFDVRRLAPAAVGVVLVLPSAVWAFLNHSIWPWDPAWYGEVSVDLWATLRNDAGNWGTAMAHAFGAKPPAVAWLGQFFVPFGGLVGGDSTALLLSIVVTQAAIVALVFAACRRLGLSNVSSFVGALLVAAAPLFISMSHEYFAEPIQTLAVAWALYVVASARRWPIALTAVQIPGIVALAMLAKLSSPAYIGAPLFATMFLAMLGPSEGRPPSPVPWRDPRVLVSALVSALLAYGAVAWYGINQQAAIDHARLAGADTGLYGVNKGFVKQLPEWLGWFRDASFLPHIGPVILALSAASLVLLVRRRGARPTLDQRLVAAATCVLTIAVVLVLFASQANTETRYLLGLVPCIAILVAIVIDASGSRNLVVAVAVVAGFEFGLGELQSFGQTPIASMSDPRLTAPSSETPFARELNDVVDQTCTPGSSWKINMVGADYPWFNHNTLEMLAFERYRLSGLRCYYTALGYAEKDPEVAWKRLQQFLSPYYISIDYGDKANPLPAAQQSLIAPSDPFNVVNIAIFNRVRASKSYDVVPGSRRSGVIVLKQAGKGGG
jgi:hypothetical protein